MRIVNEILQLKSGYISKNGASGNLGLMFIYIFKFNLNGALECAAIKNRIENLDIISIGSNINNFHTTKEITYVDSWIKIYDLLIELFASF